MGRPASARRAASPRATLPAGARRAALAAGSSPAGQRPAGLTLTLWRSPHPQLPRRARPSAGSLAGGRQGKDDPRWEDRSSSLVFTSRGWLARTRRLALQAAPLRRPRLGPSVGRGRPCGWSPPPAWVLRDRIPLAAPLTGLPTVSLEVPSTASAVFDHAPAGGRVRGARTSTLTPPSRLACEHSLPSLIFSGRGWRSRQGS